MNKEQQKQIWMKEQYDIASQVQIISDDDDDDDDGTCTSPSQQLLGNNDDFVSYPFIVLDENSSTTTSLLSEEEKDDDPGGNKNDQNYYYGGVDVSFPEDDTDEAVAVYTILDARTMESVYTRHMYFNLTVPYIPSFLAFREIEPLQKLVQEQLTEFPEFTPSAILVDGNGIFHTRHAGIACFLGVLTGIPTIGVGKTLFCTGGLTKSLVEHALSKQLQHAIQYLSSHDGNNANDDGDKQDANGDAVEEEKQKSTAASAVVDSTDAVTVVDDDTKQYKKSSTSTTADNNNNNNAVTVDSETNHQNTTSSQQILYSRCAISGKQVDDESEKQTITTTHADEAEGDGNDESNDNDVIDRKPLVQALSKHNIRGLAVPLRVAVSDADSSTNVDSEDDSAVQHGEKSSTTRILAAALVGHGGRLGKKKHNGKNIVGTTNPIYISVGHKISLLRAVLICAQLSLAKIPEPIRQADLMGRELLRKKQKQQQQNEK